MHAIANLRRPRLVDAFIGQILVIHVSGHHMLPIRLAAPYISMPTDEGESARETGNFRRGPPLAGCRAMRDWGGVRSAKRLRTQHIEEEISQSDAERVVGDGMILRICGERIPRKSMQQVGSSARLGLLLQSEQPRAIADHPMRRDAMFA